MIVNLTVLMTIANLLLILVTDVYLLVLMLGFVMYVAKQAALAASHGSCAWVFRFSDVTCLLLGVFAVGMSQGLPQTMRA